MQLPRLKHCTFIAQQCGRPTLAVVGGRYFEVELKKGEVDLLFRSRRFFDGAHSVEDAAQKMGISTENVLSLLNEYRQAGFLREPENRLSIPTLEFLERIERVSDSWTAQLGYHKLFQWLEAGRGGSQLFLGLLIETYHYVAAASLHIASAIRHAESDACRHLFSEYLAEEYDHARLLLESLERMGMPSNRIRASIPSPGTQALTNLLIRIGEKSSLEYCAAMSFVEARSQHASGALESVRRMTLNYGFPADSCEPLLSHMTADLELGHQGLLSQMLAGQKQVEKKEADQVVNTLHELKHGFDLFHDQVLSYYTGPSNCIPRTTLDFSSIG